MNRLYSTLNLFIATSLLFTTSLQALEKQQHGLVIPIVEAFKSGNKEIMSDYFRFPLKRQYPISHINDKEEFIARFDEVFDSEFLNTIVNSDLEEDWRSVGWKGIMLSNGKLWLNQKGRVWSMPYQSETEKSIRNKIIESQRQSLHESIRSFKSPSREWKTRKFHIRVDKLDNDNYRYAAWPINKPPSEKPDIVLTNGKIDYQGAGGNHNIVFTNGKYRYTCNITMLSESPTTQRSLEVYKGDELILREEVLEALEDPMPFAILPPSVDQHAKLEWNNVMGIFSENGQARLDIGTRATKENIPAPHDSWATRLVIKRLDGPSTGSVMPNHVVGLFSEDGRFRLDIGTRAMKENIPAYHNSGATRFRIVPLTKPALGPITYDTVVGVFSEDGQTRLDIGHRAVKEEVPASFDYWATRLKIHSLH